MSNIFRQLRGSQSLRSFVKPLGITAQTWNLWERNISSPSMPSIRKLKEVLGVDVFEVQRKRNLGSEEEDKNNKE